jgi:hypothetical protein
MWQYLRKLLGWRSVEEEWRAGYQWAVQAYISGKSLEEIEQIADNAWDFRDFDSGALDAVSDLRIVEETKNGQ